MRTALLIFQFIISLALIIVVVIQSSKGEGLGSIGGGAQMFFAANKGMEAFLNKATTVIAVLFMVSSIVVAAVSF